MLYRAQTITCVVWMKFCCVCLMGSARALASTQAIISCRKRENKKRQTSLFVYCVRRYILHGIRRYALHHMRHNACSALGTACGKRGSRNVAIYAANGSLIERAHIFPDANGRILPNKAKRRGISPRRDVAFVLAESESRGRVFCDKRRI